MGSKSPRRKQILEQAGYSFSIVTTDEDEVVDPSLPKEAIPEYLALQKANFILPTIQTKEFVLITADTIVLLNDEIIGKPVDLDDARRIIGQLSGQTHKVISGVCLCNHERSYSFSDEALVHFDELSSDEIEHYIEHYEVMDKAGAYAVQEWIGLIGIKGIEGSYYNIMGLPIHKVYHALKKFNGHYA